jgi:D-aminoacyl-tRNA deacylase
VRIVLQRVSEARVDIDGAPVARIGAGLLLLVGAEVGDDHAIAARMASKVAALRLFPGDGDRGFDRSLVDVGGEALVVSQFTLMGDVRRGNRPSWAQAARPAEAEPVVEEFATSLGGHGVPVARGVFGAMMHVSLINDGPVTLVLDSSALAGPRRA